MRWRSLGLVALAILLGATPVTAQAEYWYAPLPNHTGYPTTFVATTTTSTPSSMQVSLEGMPFPTLAIPGKDSVSWTTPTITLGTGIHQDAGYRIETSEDVTVTYFLPIVYNNGDETADAGRMVPLELLGTEYWVFSYPMQTLPGEYPFIAIVAPYDDTMVSVTPTSDVMTGSNTPSINDGTTLTRELDDHDVWMLQSQGDLTGSRVVADKPIAVFSGHECATVGNSACDHISEQLMPTELGGDRFPFCSTVPDRSSGYDLLRVIALEPSPTTIVLTPPPASVPGGMVTLSGAGDWEEFPVTRDLVLSADHDIAVAAYFGKTDLFSEGDPSMVVLTPADRLSTARAFYVPPDWDLELTVAYERDTLVIFDDSILSPDRAIAGTDFDCIHTSLTTGTHELRSGKGLSASVWATQEAASFWYEAGGAILPTIRWSFDNSAATCEDSAVRFWENGTLMPEGRSIRSGGWDFGDGESAIGLSAEHTFAEPGLYRVTLSIQDDRGAVRRMTKMVESIGDPDCPPRFLRDYERSVYADTDLRVCIAARDFEPYPLTYSVVAPVPDGLAFTNRFCLDWRPTVGQVGDHFLTLQVDDGTSTARTSLLIHVLPPDPDPPDQDRDGIADIQDNCPSIPNRDQLDTDLDGQGDVCQVVDEDGDPGSGAGAGALLADRDGDGVPDRDDLCPSVADAAQADRDQDRVGDVCDADADGDGIVGASPNPKTILDNCPEHPNPDQADADLDGAGDACDATPMGATATTSTTTTAPVATREASAPAGLGLLVALVALAVGLARRRPA